MAKKKTIDQTNIVGEKVPTLGENIQIGEAPKLPRLVSYTLKATIRTGEYESLSPVITVEANTIEQAYEFAMGHIKDLTQKYSTNVDRSAPMTIALSDHYEKVLKVIGSASDPSALDSYSESVRNSKKLSLLEKQLLNDIINERRNKKLTRG
jgi:hypothetical protein